MATRKTRLHRLTTHVLLFSLVADPFALQAAASARWNGVAADLLTAGLPWNSDLPSATAAVPAAASAAAKKGAPALPTGLSEKAATCAEDLTQHRAPLVSLVKTLLWPPNHSLVDVGLGVDVTTPCEGRVTTRVAVFADEPDEDQTGDGNVPGDARIDGTTLYLRSERKGNADGRVYLVLTTSTLPDGTSGTACATVTVPRSRSQADLASIGAQASAAQAYCDANHAAPPSFFELTEGVLTLANVPPAVNAGPDQAVDFPGSAVLHGTATDDGRPNGTLSVSWSKVAGPGTVTFSSPGTAETTASFSAAGTYTLRLTADDGQLVASDDAVVVVAVANEAPQVDAGPDQEITLPEARVTLDGTATDDGRPAGSTLTTTWSVFSPAGAAVSFANVHVADTTATLPGAGEYVLRLTANDGQFGVSDDVRVTVHAQPPPVLTIEDTAVPEGHEGTTAAAVTLTLSYAWPQPVTVDYITEDDTAVAGCDYRTAFGTVTFVPGQTTAELLVPVAGELAPEADETVRIRVGNVSQATLARAEATLTVLNDDAANTPPGALSNRAPADRANGVALPPTLTWSAVDPDAGTAGDVLTHDVHLGTSFATSGQSWARTCPANQGPGPRTAPVAGYDEASDRLILFGGTGTTDESLWILDHASAAGGPPQWAPVPTTGGPVGLGHAASVYDAATNRLFVVGGCSGDCLAGSDQTWILTNANGLGGPPAWSLLAGAGPGPRIDHTAAIAAIDAIDPATRRLIVFGGSNAGVALGDVWLLSNLDGQPSWQALPASGAGPVRSGMTASYDPERNVLVVFGGRTGTQALSDTWVLSHANGSGGSAVWSRLAPAGTSPPARWGHAAAYDSVTGRLVVYGGSTASANPATRFVFRDVWMLTGAAGAGSPEWIQLSPNAGPTGHVQAAGVYSGSENRLVVFGGTSSTSTATDEVWVLSDAAGTLPLVTSDSATHFTAEGLVPGAVYYWRVVSRDDHGAARGSAVWRFTSNAPPSVEAGPDQTITLPASVVTLNGTGTDDGLPTGVLTFAWAASGPGPVAFADASSAVTTASFAAPGTYVLRLTAVDSQLSASDELTVTVLSEPAAGRTWTTAGDFAEGQPLHVNGDGDRLQLDETAGAYPFVWIAVSSKGTIVKIDARTGTILGEYFSAPNGQPRNPSRTTVDLNGNVWTANRDGNSIVHIGNEENGQCVDRNGNGVIDTSRQFGDLRPWANSGGADTDGGISTAADECILHYTRVSAQGTRHLSITKDNDVWVSGKPGVSQPFDLVDGRTGFIKRSEASVGFGGYGGLIDRNGVIWSARPLLRWDTSLPLAGPNGGNWKGFNHDSYGLCIDPQGNVWETSLEGPTTGNPATTGILRKWAPDGTLLGTFGHGFARAQGCAVDARGDVWVAHVLDGTNSVGHVKNNGAFVGNVIVPSGPTGVAVDLFGTIWTSNHNSRNVSRIDPNAGPIGADGVTRIGAVDFTTPDLGGIPYNYSDMTGSTLVGAPREGRWSVVFDSGMAGAKWGLIRWNESRCGDGSLSVRVASSLDGLAFTADQPAASGQEIPVPDGRYLRVTVTFTRATTGESPILYDLSVGTEAFTVPGDDAVQPPQVDAGPDQSVETPNEAILNGSACDDGRPVGALDVSWSKVSGPGDVRFSASAQPKTRARFVAAGSFDAAEDFSETANPSGPWSYGWKPTRTGTFTPGLPSMYFGMPCWIRTRVPNFAGLPVIARGPREQTYVFGGGSVFLPAEMLYLHPGSAGQNAVVRWTAPAAGSYRIEGRFQAISTGNPTVDVAILHNATTLFTGNTASFGQAAPFVLVRNVAAGDILDFSVGLGNGSSSNDNTGLAVSVVPVDAAGVAGTYVLRLSGGDSAGGAQDEVAVTVTTPECVAPPAGTVAWWPADGLATDLLGGPSGTLAGGMGFGAGMAGQAFFFDGVDDAVTVPASPALNVQALTLEGWVFPTDPRGQRPIFEYGISSAGDGVHLWQNLNTAVQQTPGALYANLIDSSGTFHILATGAGVLAPNTWNHVALTYDPASGKARLYANGRLQVEHGAGTFVPKTNLPFNIGHRPGSGFRFAGGIDEATVVGRALTAEEIQEIYFAGALGKCKDGINQPPRVDAGPDRAATLRCDGKAILALQGSVTDDGRPAGSTLTTAWSPLSGPGTVTFSTPNAAATNATFPAIGDYTLRLAGSDSQLVAQDVAAVHVAPFLPPSGNFVTSGIIPSHNGQNGPEVVTVSGLTVGRTYSLYLWGSWAYGNGDIGSGTVGSTLVSGFGNPTILLNASVSPFTSTAPLVIRRFEATATSATLAVQDLVNFYFDNVGQLFFQIYEGVPGEPLAVNAGSDQILTQPVGSAILTGSVLDAGLPSVAGTSLLWTQVSGPAAGLAAPASATTGVTLSQTGTYVFRLRATSCIRSAQDDVTLVIVERPDLVATSVNVSGLTVDGQTLAAGGSVSAQVANSGGPAGAFGVTFFEDRNGDGTLDPADGILGTASVASLGAGQTTAASAAVSGSVQFAGSPVHVFVDSGAAVAETNENNNHAQSCANGCAQPDLTASYVRMEEIAGSLTLTARIGNGGGSTVAAGVPVSFYDRDPATVGTRIATVATLGALAPGRFVDVSVTIPATTVARPLWVVADDQGGLVGTVIELDETNNAHNSWLFLSPTPNVGPAVDTGSDQRLVHPQRTAILDGTATDDGLPLGELTTQWSVVQQPVNATVLFADFAAVDTTATFSAAGTYVLRLTADDGQETGTDDVTIVIEPANQPPVVDAGPNRSITTQTTTLDGTVTDDGLPAGSAVTVQWSKLQGPGTAAFTNASAVDTTVTFNQEGHYVLQLSASDSTATGSDTVQIDVAFANAAPVVNAGPDRTLTLPANSLTLTGTATDDGLPLGSALTFKWSAVVSPGVVTFGAPAALETTATFSDPGVYVLRLTAYDGAKQTSDTVNVSVGATAPVGNAPVVALTAPLDGARVTSPIPFVATATSDSLASWKLEYRLEGDTTYTRFAAGTTPVTAGPLGTFDPSLLLNGIYEVRLTATDTAGRSTRISVQVVVKDNLKVGHFTLSFVDLDVPVAGLPIQVIRTYDSRDKGKGDFGFGWRLGMSNVRLAEKGVVGLAFEGVRQGGFFPTYCLQLAEPQVVTVTLTDGTVHEFQPVLTPSCQQFVPIEAATVTYQPLPGTHASLAAAGDGYVFVEGSWPGPMDLYDASLFHIYDPEDYVLTLADGTQLSLNQGSGLKRVKDLNGNTLTVSSSGITHSSGRGITFSRDAQGRIAQITDPDNHSMTYGYDAVGDLASFTDRETHTTTFTYNPDQPHLLETIKDPRGKQPIRNEYYDDGRIKSHTDAFGKTITYTHDLTGRQEVVTDRDGGVRVLEFDERGNVVRETDPEGKVIDRTFDARNNRRTETLPHDPGAVNPPKTTYFYDAQDDLRSVTDPENNTTEYTYNARKQIVLMRDPRGTYTLNAYDANGNLFSTKTSTSPTGSPVLSEVSSTYRADGNLETRTEVVDGVACVTRYEYNGSGYLLKETDGLGHAASYTYDASGNRLTQTTTRTTPAGFETLTTTYEYDKLGRLLKATDPDSTFNRTVYDETGRQKETHDKLGRVTKFDYDDMGRLVLTTYPDLTTEEATYNGEGHRLTFKDRAGRATKYKYDTLGRLTRTTYPDETFTESVFDSAGRLKESKDARGNTTFYGYDTAGRRTSVRVPLGGGTFAETVYTYDANGNLKTARNANQHTVTYEYDEHNRRTKTIFPDGTYRQTTYDILGRRRVERDQAGKLTKFDYDCLDRLTTVTQRNGGVDLITHYEYDEVGNRILQRDANGHETHFEYDELGRETARTLPDGKTETRTYWPTGSLKTRTDFMSRTTSYEYDENEQLTTRTYPAGTLPTASFTYTPTGQRKTVSVAGETTQYDYDLRDRLKTISYPDARMLEYDYDGNSNRTVLKATVGGQTLTTSFLYDPANRLDVVTDPAARTYDYGYDPAGNRTSLSHPNGVATTYNYDDLNRLRNLATNRAATGVTIQSYGFTLGPSGNRTEITEGDGTVRKYGYDDLYRLISETVTIGSLPQYEKAFTYDAVGNRITQTTNGAGAAGTPLAAGSLTYGYDTRDRLETENGTLAGQPVGITYDYDDNGNLITKSGEATYVWDVENRLIRAETGPSGNTTVVTYAYDADGNRLQTRVTPPTGPPTVTNYLVDSSGSLSHVVAEADSVGALKSYYVRGADLLAVMRPLVPTPATPTDWQSRFIHADGIGSIRRLTNESGAITDGYTYTAFGERIAHTGTDPQPYAFAGEPYDPNIGFQYHRARWMDPRVGRFTAMDPYLGVISDPRSLHSYLYAHDDAVNRLDPTGLFTLDQAIVAVQIRISFISAAGTAGLYKAVYVARQLRGLNWELRILTDLSSRLSGVSVGLQEVVGVTRSRIDIVLQRGVEPVRRMAIEAKNWDFDGLAHASAGRLGGMLSQLSTQAGRYVGEYADDLVYSFSQRPTTEAGLRFMAQVESVLRSSGVRAITYGTEELASRVLGRL